MAEDAAEYESATEQGDPEWNVLDLLTMAAPVFIAAVGAPVMLALAGRLEMAGLLASAVWLVIFGYESGLVAKLKREVWLRV